MKKLLNKFISTLAILGLLTVQILTPAAALAQELTPTPSPDLTVAPTETPTPSASPEVTPTPSPTAEPTPSITPPTDSQPVQVLAYVYTDKSDYTPTEKVLLYGNNFSANQQYQLEITSQDPPPVDYQSPITMDNNGTFATTYQLDGNYRPNYVVDVKDGSGNTVATTTFTDTANKVGTIAVSSQGAALTSGTASSTTYTVTVNRATGPGTSGSFSANLSIITSLPSGATSSFTPNPITFAPSDNTKTSTLTITTTVATPANNPGGVTFTVKATNALASADNATTAGNLLIGAGPSDTTPPVISPNVTGTLGTNGWYTSDVNVSWNVSDPESSVSSSTGCGSTTIITDTTGTTLTCSATSAGGTSSNSVTIKRDATAPNITLFSRTPANGNGWNNTSVTLIWSCSDVTSGVVSATDSHTLTGEGAGQSSLGTCTDNAGNTATNNQTDINIDTTAPTVTTVNSDGQTYNLATTSPHTIQVIFSEDIYNTPTISVNGDGQSVNDCSDLDAKTFCFAYAIPNGIDATTETISVSGAQDVASNTMLTNGSHTFMVDTLAPTLTSVGIQSNNTHTNMAKVGDTVTVTFNASESITGSSVTINGNAASLTGSGTGPYAATYTMTSGDTEGTVTFNISGYLDLASNPGVAVSTTSDVSSVIFDRTSPAVTITTPPNGAYYIKTHKINAAWTATDANIDSINPTTANGAPIYTTTVGTFLYTVTATDLAGNSTTVTNSYTVETYNIGGGLLPPINVDGKTFKQTSTIPVKFKLNFSNGSPVTDALGLLSVVGPNPLTTSVPGVSSGGSNTLNQFRYDSSGKQYIFNLSTKTLTAGKTYNLVIALDDGQQIIEQVILK